MSETASVTSCSSPKYASPLIKRSVELGSQITHLCGYINAANAELLELIRQFDQEGLWKLDGVCSSAHWLNWKCGIGMNAAREKVRVANTLGELPKTRERFASGELSYSKVRAMTRIATAENEEYLLMIARNGTGAHMDGLVSRYRRCERLRDSQNANKQHEERELHIFYEPDGSMVIKARLPADQGALVLKALESATKALENESGNAPDVSAETRDGGEEIRPPASRQESFQKKRADALVAMADSWLGSGPKASSLADRYQVMLHVSAETLTDDDGELSHLEDGPGVSAETSRRLCCDAGISVLTKDSDGETLNIGRKSRVIPLAMRRALRFRDDGCRFPGCTHKHFIDGHHIQHWSKLGETSLDNLVQLCRHHHRLVHEGGFGCEKNAAGQIEFRDQQGKLIARTGYIEPARLGSDINLRLRHRYEDLFIDSQTCVSRYDGGGIDWDLAVGALYQ